MTADKKLEGTDPVVFQTQTLGRPVRLGELYDQHSQQFLGVQLYSEDDVKVVETDIKHTELSLSLSTTLEDKASLLDIYAKLTLEILSGMVSVSGSASYVKDTKSNTNEQAFALALKMRLNEKRILFAEDAMGRNVLRIASEDYIVGGAATHFVSSIVFGGALIVNLVARQSKLDTDEKLEGELQAKFNGLKGAISLEGEVKAQIKDKFNSMDDKFDLVIHGDVALDRVPVNPKDVLDIIPNAAELIKGGGGVPISVTLQPIPKKLLIAGKVYEIEARLVDEVMKEFSNLDDLRSRFSVLVDGAKSVEEFVPELFRVARIVADRYAEEHGTLLHDLRKFLYDYQHGTFPGDWDKPDYEIQVLKDARELHNRHLLPDGDPKYTTPSQYYPSSLVGLEIELLKFQYFVSDIQRSRDSVMSLADSCKKFVCLSSLDTISRAIRLQNLIPLFVMSPFTPKQPQITPDLTPDLAIIQFLAKLRQSARYFNDPTNAARILYAETLESLERRLPDLIDSSGLKGPALRIGKVDSKGKLSWSDSPKETELYLNLHHKQEEGKLTELSQIIDGLNGRESFTLQLVGKPSTTKPEDNLNSVICILRTKVKSPYLKFRTKPLSVEIQHNQPNPLLITTDTTPSDGQLFVLTLVQDAEVEKTITLYLENDELDHVGFSDPSDLLSDSTNVEIAYPGEDPKEPAKLTKWWDGELLEVTAFSHALTLEQVKTEVKRAHDAHPN